jgi:hypothetical protein
MHALHLLLCLSSLAIADQIFSCRARALCMSYDVAPFNITCHYSFSRYTTFVMYLNIIYIYVHNKKNVFREVGMTSNMKQMENMHKYYLACLTSTSFAVLFSHNKFTIPISNDIFYHNKFASQISRGSHYWLMNVSVIHL